MMPHQPVANKFIFKHVKASSIYRISNILLFHDLYYQIIFMLKFMLINN